jgi:tetratricopeptide (TPR) repeat protein
MTRVADVKVTDFRIPTPRTDRTGDDSLVGNRLAEVRAKRGWKKLRLISELRRAAARHGETLPKNESVGRRVANWENQGGTVGEFYRDLLCEVYSMTPAELGIDEPPPLPGPVRVAEPLVVVEEGPQLLRVARIDTGLVTMLRGHTQSIRLLDRRLGGEMVFQQTTAHVNQIEDLLRFALPGAPREAAADELGQAAALAGWQALNMGQLDEAWRMHELAKTAARESGVTAGLAYATAQQAFVLLDAGRTADALLLVESARAQAGTNVPDVLRSWLHAAEGEVLAALGRRDFALRALEAASETLPEDADESGLPYLMLDGGQLARWRGHCLARLGEATAIDDLTSALESMEEGRYGRAEASLRVDLAIAYQALGDTAQARAQAARAAEVAGRTGSQRQRRRIAALLLA